MGSFGDWTQRRKEPLSLRIGPQELPKLKSQEKSEGPDTQEPWDNCRRRNTHTVGTPEGKRGTEETRKASVTENFLHSHVYAKPQSRRRREHQAG